MMTAVVPVSQIGNLPEVRREQAITAYLAGARDALTNALAASGVEAVASIKAEVSTVAEMTKQLGLSKECRDDATEMVRRAEYALGKAIRQGQEEGTVSRVGTNSGPRSDYVRSDGTAVHVNATQVSSAISPKQLGGTYELVDAYAMADNATAEEFEEALSAAREEGNLSRNNVVRKVKGLKSGQTRSQRAEIIAEMAAEGHHRDQVARHLGLGRKAVNDIARDYGIDFPADSVGRVRRTDSARIVRETVNTLEGLLMALPLVDFDDLDPTEADEWTASLTKSLSELRRFNNKIKEAVR